MCRGNRDKNTLEHWVGTGWMIGKTTRVVHEVDVVGWGWVQREGIIRWASSVTGFRDRCGDLDIGGGGVGG